MNPPRVIHRPPGFEKDVRALAKKYPAFKSDIDSVVDEIAAADKLPGDLIPGLDGAPVFKLRIPYGNRGKRGGARLIYYCAENLLIPMYLYAKADTENIATAVIREALKGAGLLARPADDP